MTKPFWPSARFLEGELDRAEAVLVILDFDGTLAPLVDRPTRAKMSPTNRRALKNLTGAATVAVFSGRALSDVRRRVAVRPIYFGGNHGVEMAGPSFRYVNPRARRYRAHAPAFDRLARRVFDGIPGVHLEAKGFGLSVHYRAVPYGRMAEFNRRLAALKKETDAVRFHWTTGHLVWEIRPRVGWNKGQALLLLWRRLGRPFVVCVGDDVTDEDMFRAVRGCGVGVKIGRGRTEADFRLRRQGGVLRFLRWLHKTLSRRSSRP